MQNPDKNTQSSSSRELPTILTEILPESFALELVGEWDVSPDLAPEGQIIRIVNRAEDYLAGIGAEGGNKGQLKAEAGRMLVYLKSLSEDDGFLSAASQSQRDHIKDKIASLWNEGGGREANDLWVESHKARQAVQGENEDNLPRTVSRAEQVLEAIDRRRVNISKIYDAVNSGIDRGIDFIKTIDPDHAAISSLELYKRILERKLNLQELATSLENDVSRVRENIRDGSTGEGYDKVEAEKQLVTNARKGYARAIEVIIEIANNLYSISENMAESSPIRTTIIAIRDDIDDSLKAFGGVEKIDAKKGDKVDFDAMEPIAILQSSDPESFSEPTIASVVGNGYRFGGDMSLFSGQGADIICPVKVEVYKSTK